MASKHTFSHAGDTYHNFKITKKEAIDELGCDLIEIEHLPTGAQIVHIANDDPENVFCIALRTLPEDSTGVAHILEHTVLCGSKKYPVRDPFFSMTRRSLNTYMNALTGPDFTCYPAASQVPKDFYNLLEVYLDAVFHPELKELSFLQEGHRLEFQKPEDPSSPLIFKGIVFNEMKGGLSSPMSRLWNAMMEKLFPDILYRHNFGGEPLDIPNLTYQGLKDFHGQFYQESRATFYFYGNLPIEKHLDFLEEKTLKDAKKLEPLKPNPEQPHFDKPHLTSCPYPIAAHEDLGQKTYTALSWLICPAEDQLDVLALQILDIALMGNDAAPLKMKLLDSGLCQNVHSVLEDELSQVPYGLVFEGTEKEDQEKIKDFVLKSLKELTESPLDPELIRGAMHQLEFSRTEINSDYGPFGLSLIFKLLAIHNVGGKLENALKIHSLFDELREKIEDKNYFTSLIKKYFVDNPHLVVLSLYPDPELSKKEQAKEEKHLQEIESQLSENDKKKIVEQAGALKDLQEEMDHQDLEVLPKVTLDDVAKTPRKLELQKEKMGPANAYFHSCFTNGVIYQDLVFDLPAIDEEDLPYVRLFAYLITQIGSKDRSYIENLNLIQNHTGGIVAFLDSYIDIRDQNQYTPKLIFKGKALEANYDQLTDLMYDMITSPVFEDSKRLKELLSQLFVEIDHDLKQNSLRYAVNLSCSGFYEHSYISYFWSGLGYYYLVKEITSNIEKELPKLIDKMKMLKSKLLHAKNYDVITTCPEKTYTAIQPSLSKLCSIESSQYTPWVHTHKPHQVKSQARISSSPVFFTSVALKTVPFVDPDNAYLSIASRLMDNTTLHRVIREQGGAYGGGASNKMSSSKFCFYAYRDPNLANTIEAFKTASKHIEEGQFSERELEEAKLGILQKLDHPIAPEYKGLTAYSWQKEGKDYNIRSELRARIINAKAEDIQEAVQKHLVESFDQAVIVSFGSKDAIEKENKKLEGKKLLPLLTLEV